MIGAPTPDQAAILSALAKLFTPKDVIELRAFDKGGKKRTHAGYFDADHWDELAGHAARLNRSGAAVYVTLNPVDPQLLGRYTNRIEPYAPATTTDKQVSRRRWMLIDLDPVRPSGTSATDAQLEAARVKARQVSDYLHGIGWPAPGEAESGNGFHLLCAIDLPNDDGSTALVKSALLALAAKFDDAQTKVDKAVFNAARICKLYGTVANKGDHTTAAPWRLSKLLKTPDRQIVTVEQLRALQPLAPIPTTTNPHANTRQRGAFALEAFLTQHGIEHTPDLHDGRERFKLAACPFNADHINGQSAIFREASGKLGFKCQHDSCSEKAWRDVRKLLDGPRTNQPTGPGADEPCIEEARALTAPTALAGAAQWPEMQELIAQIKPLEYPIDALPATVRCAVMEVAGFVKAPIPLIAASALAALSLAIQPHNDVQRAEKLSGPCSVFMLAIADSGERKSTCDGFFTRAIKDYEARQQEKAKPRIGTYESDHAIWGARRSGLKEKIKTLAKQSEASATEGQELHKLDKDEPRAPRVPRLIYGDTTPEALAWALAKRWPSGGVISSEAGSVFGGHGMGADSVMRNLAALNQLWDGATLLVERRTSESFAVRGARLTMALQVQEPTIRAFVADTKGLARGTGFLARFLVSWPESTQGTRNFTEAPANWPALTAFNTRITTLLDQAVSIDADGALAPAMLKLSPQAKALWVAFHDQIESNLSTAGELHDVRDVASKAADNAARVAALLHVFESRESSVGSIEIDSEAMESAARIVFWHLSEARRFLGELAIPAELANPARLEIWMLDYCRRENTDKVPTRQIQQYGPPRLRDKAARADAIRQLVDLGRARLIQDGKKRLIQIRPELLG